MHCTNCISTPDSKCQLTFLGIFRQQNAEVIVLYVDVS